MRRYIDAALAEQREGTALPFVTVWRATGQVIGSTRFANAALPHRRVEIGWTWLARPWQRSGANAEAKYLMLRHAFETWGLVRVELKTSTLNQQSRGAMKKLGAVEEGVLRRHMINEDGIAEGLGVLFDSGRRVAPGEGGTGGATQGSLSRGADEAPRPSLPGCGCAESNDPSEMPSCSPEGP